jgi:hypothetical protein
MQSLKVQEKYINRHTPLLGDIHMECSTKVCITNSTKVWEWSKCPKAIRVFLQQPLLRGDFLGNMSSNTCIILFLRLIVTD